VRYLQHVKYFLIILSALFLTAAPLRAQFSESKERKKMWHKSKKRRKNREAFNPYLDKKTKPSQELSKQNKRDLKRQEKAARRQKRKSMKHLGIRPTKIKRP